MNVVRIKPMPVSALSSPPKYIWPPSLLVCANLKRISSQLVVFLQLDSSQLVVADVDGAQQRVLDAAGRLVRRFQDCHRSDDVTRNDGRSATVQTIFVEHKEAEVTKLSLICAPQPFLLL